MVKYIEGYGCFTRLENGELRLVSHRVCDIDSYPLVIFRTYEEAEKYGRSMYIIKKVRININKKQLQCYLVPDEISYQEKIKNE